MSGFVQKFKEMWTPPEDEYENEEDLNENYQSTERYSEPYNELSKGASNTSTEEKVVNLRNSSKLQVTIHLGLDEYGNSAA